jgi:hypothetical protein
VFTQSEGYSPTTGPRELVVAPATVTDTQLTAVVPMLDDNIAQWIVRAQRGVVGNEQRSNGKLFRRGQAGPEGRWLHYYASSADGSCASAVDKIDNLDVYPNSNVRWYLWDAGGGYCLRDNKILQPASGTLVVNGNTVTVTRCSEDIMLPSTSVTGVWDPATKAYAIPPNDHWTSKTCLRQVTFEEPLGICVAKEACKVVLNSESRPVRFHCTRACFSDPTLCPYADGVEADCY